MAKYMSPLLAKIRYNVCSWFRNWDGLQQQCLLFKIWWLSCPPTTSGYHIVTIHQKGAYFWCISRHDTYPPFPSVTTKPAHQDEMSVLHSYDSQSKVEVASLPPSLSPVSARNVPFSRVILYLPTHAWPTYSLTHTVSTCNVPVLITTLFCLIATLVTCRSVLQLIMLQLNIKGHTLTWNE